MLIRVNFNIDFNIGVILTKGTKRFHFYRNEYGVEAGWNIIPKHFGIFGYVSHAPRCRQTKNPR